MRSGSVRNMYMYNNPPCAPWVGHPGNAPVYPNAPPQYQGPPRHPMPYQMMPPVQYQPGPSWQGPGPSRPRGRGHRRGRGSGHFTGNRANSRNDTLEPFKYVCCKCGDQLQNSAEPGIHLCDGGHEVIINEDKSTENKKEEPTETGKEEELDARLEKLLENLKDFVRSKYDSVTEALEGYVSDKIDEINTLHKENSEEKASLEKLKKELETKANALIKQEKDLKEKQKRLSKDQEVFKREMKKEREEVCRQWQQLRDEITRMEEVHKIQKGATSKKQLVLIVIGSSKGDLVS
ncbi:uncharacterized protein LOC132719237 isoform X2 [Ruditapes philippinarum]|uniref:uncharacterized protein LOC132719237 isoform X2 n=1 Tax=Ruditapes philippinarum TaxID=129788 RepID=UPI00295B15D8|nr:uncharacterized protein LOC132719237 isoform X2 [Ruditapes philippinarum]XP_060558978.1 uncharacterized protein LOC132719237 isoform X2 [Ruditapes philippinarum]